MKLISSSALSSSLSTITQKKGTRRFPSTKHLITK